MSTVRQLTALTDSYRTKLWAFEPLSAPTAPEAAARVAAVLRPSTARHSSHDTSSPSAWGGFRVLQQITLGFGANEPFLLFAYHTCLKYLMQITNRLPSDRSSSST